MIGLFVKILFVLLLITLMININIVTCGLQVGQGTNCGNMWLLCYFTWANVTLAGYCCKCKCVGGLSSYLLWDS